MKIQELLDATGGELVGGSPGLEFNRISTDSRTISPGEVFFALKGKNFDGHDFISDAAGRASAVVAETVPRNLGQGICLVIVKDTLRALGDTASFIRRKGRRVPLIAVSGSAGKTTTKEMITSILGASSRRALKTEGNRNNLIGLPLTLMGLEGGEGGGWDAAVLELGISEPGEMERLVEICDPDVAVVTNVGRAHLEGLGSIEGVAREKEALLLRPRPHCVRVINLDDPYLREASRRLSAPAITFSVSGEADVMALEHRDLGDRGVEAAVSVGGERASFRLVQPGAFNLSNALAAIASLLPLGVSLSRIEEGLGSWAPLKGRMQVLRVSGLTVIDDTYNANPESVSAALKALSFMKGRKVAVLGEMLELGSSSSALHREAGRIAGQFGIDLVFCIGPGARHTAQGAIEAGLKPDDVLFFEDKKEALAGLRRALTEGDVVLVKGSRGCRLEEVVEGLAQESALRKALC